jgi:hypothetical protein
LITRDEMLPYLVAACPSFAPNWESFKKEWGEHPGPVLYLALADFARHLVGKLSAGDKKDLKNAFAAIERLHIEGDAWVREAATIGILESLQNGNLHTATEPEQFRPYLGRESARWWDKLYRFWDRVDQWNATRRLGLPREGIDDQGGPAGEEE